MSRSAGSAIRATRPASACSRTGASQPGIYIDKGYGASISFTRNVAARSPLSLVYRYELTQVDAGDVYFCVNYGVCELATIGLLRNRNALSPVALDFYHGPHGRDRSIRRTATRPGPISSMRRSTRCRISGTIAPRARRRCTGPMGRRGARRTHSRRVGEGDIDPSGTTSVDGLNDVLHPRKRFYAGGANSVRGYGENQLGPRILTIDPAKLIATRAARTSDDRRMARAIRTGAPTLDVSGTTSRRCPRAARR